MNKLNKHLILLLLMLSGFSLTASAQAFRAAAGGGGVNQAQRIARRPNVSKEVLRIKKDYIAKQLDLTTEQSVRFMSKFEEYQEDYNSVLALWEESKGNFAKEQTYKQQLIGIQTHYYEEFLKILGSESKASQVFTLERQFNLEVIRRLKESKVPVRK